MPPASTDSTARGFQAALRLSPALSRLLAARGWSDVAAVTEFLFPRLEHTHSPWLMRGMEAAATRLLAAAAAREPVLILGDYDVDGTMAVVILRQALASLGAAVRYRLPHRLQEGYGLPPAAIEQAAAEGTRLLVTVDTGIREIASLRRAQELGLEVIVTDHHLPGEELPPALAILNPHQPGCSYPDKGLCGTGIAFKLVQALLEREGRLPQPWSPQLQSYLKLVALGTIADAVPLLGENRVLTRFGLQGLAQPVNPGLRALLDLALPGRGDAPVRSLDVAFRLAPRLNAAGRLEAADQVVELFSATAQRAATMAQALETLNQQRQQLCADTLTAGEALLAGDAGYATDRVLVLGGAGWHRGVLGIVASRVLSSTGKPVLVAGIAGGLAQGSGRAPAGFHLLDALEAHRDLFDGGRFGGHAQAVGFSLPAERLPALRAALQDRDVPEPGAARRWELELRLPEINAELARDLQRLEPFGEGNREPVFHVNGAVLAQAPQVLKEKHLKLMLEQDGARCEALAWNCWKQAKWNPGAGWPELAELRPGALVDVSFRLEISRHPQYGERRQLIVVDLVSPRAQATHP